MRKLETGEEKMNMNLGNKKRIYTKIILLDWVKPHLKLLILK